MARLDEHRAKEVLGRFGMPVPPGERAETPMAAREVARRLGGDVVVKALVLSGGRGKRGAVRKATEANVERVAADILGMALDGTGVQVVRVERLEAVEAEWYAAVLADPYRRQPVIAFGTRGGVEVEVGGGEVIVQPVDIRRGLLPHEARTAARRAGLFGPPLLHAATALLSLWRCYRELDCTLVEVNPLGWRSGGCIALDAKITLDDDALFRHADLNLPYVEDPGNRPPTGLELAAGAIDRHDHRGSCHFVQLDPWGENCRHNGFVPVAFNGVGGGSSLVMLDELVPLGFFPVNFSDTSGNPVGSKLYRMTKILLSQPSIEGYVFAICVPSSQRNDNLIRGIIKAFRELYPERNGVPNIPCLFALMGTYTEETVQVLTAEGLTQGPWVQVLTNANHREAALAFAKLHADWRHE